MNLSTNKDKIAVDKHRIIDVTDSVPDITANLIHDSEHYLLPPDIFENIVFEALNELIDDFAQNPESYIKPHHQTQIDRTAQQYLNDGVYKQGVHNFSPAFSNPESSLDLPHAAHEIGSVVKVIDPAEEHTEWAVFEIVKRRYNRALYRSTEAYLSQAEWYYQLSSQENGDQLIWVAENEICAFDMSHNVCTQEVF